MTSTTLEPPGRKFVKDFSKIANPLFQLLDGKQSRKKKKISPSPSSFVWGELQQQAFEDLKSKLIRAPILGYADYTKPFEIHVDASFHGLGAILYQQQENQKRVIAFASRGLKPSERNYPAHKLEFLALKWAVTDKFHDYLYGQKFHVWTDNNPLTYVLTSARLDATGHRWLARLATYDFTIHYKMGKTNVDADALSRLPEVQQDVIQAIFESSHPAHQENLISCMPVSADVLDDVFAADIVENLDLKKIQSEDPNIDFVRKLLLHNSPPTKETLKKKPQEVQQLCRQWEKLHLVQDVIYRQVGEGLSRTMQLVVPSSYRENILTSLHDDLGHPERDKTMTLLKQRFYWPGMTKDVEQKISSCRRCLCRKAQVQKAPLVPILTTQPLELVCLDYLLVEPSYGYEHLLVMIDHFTKFARVVPTKNESARTTAKALLENFINIYGFPRSIHSDQGKCFESSVIKELCSLTGMKKSRTTPYHPMGNGACERLNQTLLKMLGTLATEKKSKWKDYINTLVHAYNCTPHEATGYAPYELLFGRAPQLPVDQEFQLKGEGTSQDYTRYVESLRERIKYSHELAQKKMSDRADSTKKTGPQKNVVLTVGDEVLVRKVHLIGRSKLADKWEDQVFIVKEQPSPDIPVYRVRSKDGKGRVRTLHRNLLLPIGTHTKEDKNHDDSTVHQDHHHSDHQDRDATEADRESSVDSDTSSDGQPRASSSEEEEQHRSRRPTRIKKPPDRYQASMMPQAAHPSYEEKSKLLLQLVDKIF